MMHPVRRHARASTSFDAMAGRFILPMLRLRLLIPPDRFDLVGLAHQAGEVLTESHEEDGIHLDVEIPERFHSHFILFAEDER